jgi:hypothetical protein
MRATTPHEKTSTAVGHGRIPASNRFEERKGEMVMIGYLIEYRSG